MPPLPITLALYDPLVVGNSGKRDLTALIGDTWRRSIRHTGGYFIGTAEIDTTQVAQGYLDELFTYGILSEMRESGGGQETWRGFLSKMDYTRKGEQYTLDMANVANSVRSIYTRVFDNLVTNGDCESGVWSSYQSPSAVGQYSGWKTSGNYSMRIVSSSSNGGVNGATAASAVGITAGVTYDIQANLRVISGSWRLGVDTASGSDLAHYSTHGTYGDHSVRVSIPNSNTYTGNCTVRITSEGTTGIEIYVDDVQFAEQSHAAATGWQSDLASIAAIGRKEDILLEGGMSDAAANAHVSTQVRMRAWPKMSGPPQYQTRVDVKDGVDKLTLTFSGYWAMLNWIFTRITGAASVSTHITSIVASLNTLYTSDKMQAPPVRAGIIETNSLSYGIDANMPLRCGDVLRDMSIAGEADGSTRWEVGVFADRFVNYRRIPPTPIYIMRNGKLFDLSGVAVAPWLARPGWCIREDMPIGPYASAYAEHDPRWEFFEEVEMLPAGQLIFNRQES